MMVAKVRRLGGVAGLAMLVVLLSAPVGLVQAALEWHIETVDSEGTVFTFTSLAIDSAGHPHISYFVWVDSNEANLKYATFDGTSWQNETVDDTGDVGWDNSLALDAAGRPHISYVDAGNTNLKYATFDGTIWLTETVDDTGIVGLDNSLALDDAGQPHISYFDVSNAALKYAAFDGSTWQIETVDALGFDTSGTSLALDTNGLPHISYYNRTTRNLKYAAFDGSSWQIETVDEIGDVGAWSSLALDSSGQPHISYFDDSNRDLKYAVFDGVDWQIQTVDAAGDVGYFTSLALDSSGRPRISYFDNSNASLKYAAFDGTDWQIQTVDAAGNVGVGTSLALDSADRPHISYRERIFDNLRYAHGTINASPTVDAGAPYTGSEGNLITLDATVTDPESDDLTTAWSYEIDTADLGTTCSFGDDSQVDTTFTCTDDGTFTVTLEVHDGLNPAVTDSVDVTISNADPAISKAIATLAGNQVTITVTAFDPGQHDLLNYLFDCDANGSYDVNMGTTSSTTCLLDPQQEGVFSFGVQVSDDDDGEATDTATLTIATELCANDYTGVLRYDEDCRDYETAITIPDPNGPVTVCASRYNGLLRQPLTGSCAGHEISYELPEDGPLAVCINRHTQVMRAADNLEQCTSHEFGRVIAASEVSDTPPRSR